MVSAGMALTGDEDGAPDTVALAESGRSRAGLDYAPPERTGAIRAAGRHTARVRFLRRAIVVGSALTISIIGFVAIFDPFHHLPFGASIGGVGVKGSIITMATPKITGLQQGGGLFDIAADKGIQDITKPNVVELVGVNAHVGMSDGTNTHVLSNHGVYNSGEDTMALDGDVKIANTSGYTFGLQSAMIDFKKGILASQQRMRVDLKGGFVLADGMTISNNGHEIAFRGHVSSTFESPEEAAEAPEPKSVAVIPSETGR